MGVPHCKAVSFIFLLLLSSTLFRFMAEGRVLQRENGVVLERFRMDTVRTRTIGSRPPRCERMCASCGQCEAVQVPVTAQNHGGLRFSSPAVTAIAFSRDEDLSNYKPMSWKCKCGDLLFNP